MNSCRRMLLVATMFVSVLGACTARRLVRPPVPGYAATRADVSHASFYLRDFQVNGRSKNDTDADVAMLREAFASYVERGALFRAVHASTPALGQIELPAVVADVVLDVGHTTKRTWILDLPAVYPMVGYWPLTPSWGDAKVQVRLAAFDPRGEPAWQGEESGAGHYSMILYSWFRTAPVELAYEQAYGEAFARVVDKLGSAIATAPASSPAIGSMIAARGATAGRKVAVLPVQLDTGAEGKVPQLIDDYLLTAVQNMSGLEVIGQDDISALLGFEKQKDLVGCDDASCLANIGGALGVDLIVAVKVALLGTDWVVTAKLINLREARVEARTSEIVAGDVKALLRSVPEIARRLFAR
ncbi:MAG: hypothetical protein AAB426_04725 [Myxococcota bacterium]